MRATKIEKIRIKKALTLRQRLWMKSRHSVHKWSCCIPAKYNNIMSWGRSLNFPILNFKLFNTLPYKYQQT